MKVQQLLNAVAATGAGTAYTLPVPININKLISQIEITTTATVVIEGRLHDDAPWVQLFTPVTADSINDLPLVRQIRANVTAFTAGTVSAWAAFE